MIRKFSNLKTLISLQKLLEDKNIYADIPTISDLYFSFKSSYGNPPSDRVTPKEYFNSFVRYVEDNLEDV